MVRFVNAGRIGFSVETSGIEVIPLEGILRLSSLQTCLRIELFFMMGTNTHFGRWPMPEMTSSQVREQLSRLNAVRFSKIGCASQS